MILECYTDGSAKGNGTSNSLGGWAFCLVHDGKIVGKNSGAVPNTTNQRMELLAVIKALEAKRDTPERTVIVYSDSAYLINCVYQKWWVNWQKNGWLNAKKQPVANRDLWEQLIPYFERPSIAWGKVKGHAGVEFNEIVDGLAQAAAESLKEER